MAQHEQLWKWINNYSEYSVSSIGQIRRKCRIVRRGGHYIKLNKNKYGYLRCVLYWFDGQMMKKGFSVHRIVAETFIPNPHNKPQVNHKNGIKDDNRIENLEWVTRIENQRHAVENGLYKNPKGETHRMAKLNDKIVIEIRKLYSTGNYYQKQLAKKYGVSQATIGRITQRLIWSHI